MRGMDVVGTRTIEEREARATVLGRRYSWVWGLGGRREEGGGGGERSTERRSQQGSGTV